MTTQALLGVIWKQIMFINHQCAVLSLDAEKCFWLVRVAICGR